MNKSVPLFIGSVAVSLFVGGVFGFQYAKQALQEEFDTRLEDEREELRRYYTRKYKRGDLETAEKAAETLIEKKTFKGPRSGADIPEGEPYEAPSEEEREVLQRAVQKLKYDVEQAEPEEKWVADSSASEGSPDDTGPKVITLEEFVPNELEYYQPTWHYYAGDDTLVDEASNVVDEDERDEIIGKGTLKCFGQGSNDIDRVYVRNKDLERDYEITRVHTSYNETGRETPAKKQRHGNRSR